MKRITALTLFVLPILLIGITSHVAFDGSGDYTSIQAAVDASAHGDTILVYPGTYYENINYSGKNITEKAEVRLEQDKHSYSHKMMLLK